MYMSSMEMSNEEINQFLACARVGISFRDGPYIVPVGYAYVSGKYFSTHVTLA